MRTKLRAILTLLLLFITLTACQQKEDPAPAEGTSQTEALKVENAKDLSAEELAVYANRINEIYLPAIEHFDLTRTDLLYFTNFYFDESLVSDPETLGLHRHLALQPGDTIPVFFWDYSSQTMYALVQRDNGNFNHYTFRKAKDPDPADTDLRNLWVQTAAPETWTPA